MRKKLLAVLVLFAAATAAPAQTADWRFRWQKGEVLNYRVEQTTAVTEVVGGSKFETRSKVNLTKRWEVVDVDAQGIATVRLSITAMRNEQQRPSGESVLFDSSAPDKSTPELRDQLGKLLGQTLAILRVDPLGKVVEVKQGPANRYDAEPPFALVLPEKLEPGKQSWTRPFAIALDPPFGGGEKIQASQTYQASAAADGKIKLVVASQLNDQGASKQQQIALVQKLAQGEVLFDAVRGRLFATRLGVDQTVQGHQGDGSSYRFQSSYVEQAAD